MQNFIYVANEFPPTATPGVYRTAKFACYLPRHGFAPLVITPRANPTGYTDVTLLAELPEVVQIHRTASLGFSARANRSKDTLRRRYRGRENSRAWGLHSRLNDAVFFMDKQIGWIPFAYRKARSLVRRGLADRALVTAFPYSSFLVGYWLERRVGIPWVADFRDALTLREEGFDSMSAARRKRCERWEERFLLSAARSVFVSETIRRRHLEKYPRVSPEKTVVIPNGFDPHDFARARPRVFEKQTLLFLGTIYEGQISIQPLLEAVSDLKAAGSIDPKGFQVLFVGRLSETWLRRIEAMRLGDLVRYEGHVPHDEAVAALLGADFLYLPLASGKRWDQTIPGKIFEYLYSRAPILGAVLGGGEAAALLERAGAGPIVPPDDAAAHRRALSDLLGGRWKRAHEGTRRAFMEPYTRQVLAGRMAEVLDGLTG